MNVFEIKKEHEATLAVCASLACYDRCRHYLYRKYLKLLILIGIGILGHRYQPQGELIPLTFTLISALYLGAVCLWFLAISACVFRMTAIWTEGKRELHTAVKRTRALQLEYNQTPTPKKIGNLRLVTKITP